MKKKEMTKQRTQKESEDEGVCEVMGGAERVREINRYMHRENNV